MSFPHNFLRLVTFKPHFWGVQTRHQAPTAPGASSADWLLNLSAVCVMESQAKEALQKLLQSSDGTFSDSKYKWLHLLDDLKLGARSTDPQYSSLLRRAAQSPAAEDDGSVVEDTDGGRAGATSEEILAEMALGTGLTFFFFMLDRDPEAKTALLTHAAGMVSRIPALGLSGLGPLHEESLDKVEAFLVKTALEDGEARARDTLQVRPRLRTRCSSGSHTSNTAFWLFSRHAACSTAFAKHCKSSRGFTVSDTSVLSSHILIPHPEPHTLHPKP